ncbi:hypothetical protein CK203_031231 [Vitis vinifera]|uniref:Reverse transcriptase domain-containing protein n=1 Tax=Vitis vinifera TaxID=29760 RepID=A0A438IXC5_VITVI|nr:hypothetical protein CK203_031231 [Vitis vinifera]
MVEYPKWLANVIPVPKKDDKVRVYVDFQDLNKASPKDDFPLPHIDMLVDSTTVIRCCPLWTDFLGIVRFDGSRDMEKTSFITEWVQIETESQEVHFWSDFWETLGYMVSERGIEVDPDKIRVILDMPAPGQKRGQRAIDDDFQTRMCCVTSLSVGTCTLMVHQHSGYGIDILLISPHGDHIPRSVRLDSGSTSSTNNIVEYEACILGLEMPLSSGLDIWRCLVTPIGIRHIQGEWKTRDVKLRPSMHIWSYWLEI